MQVFLWIAHALLGCIVALAMLCGAVFLAALAIEAFRQLYHWLHFRRFLHAMRRDPLPHADMFDSRSLDDSPTLREVNERRGYK
jgi:hypothetical protein